jgi:hypothetical protein
MNPRFVLREKWFQRSLARMLRTFWDDFKAGKRPVMLLLLEHHRGTASRSPYRLGGRPRS